MKNIYILDAVNFLFRSYYAIGSMTNSRGESTNALYGFIRSVYKIIKERSPEHLIAVFDGPDNTKTRKAIYPEYKSHREGMPEDLYPQLAWASQFCEIAGIPHLTIPGVEADDVMGTVAIWAKERGAKAYLCSSDKDLCQLVDDSIFLLNINKENLLYDRAQVKEAYGVYPEQMIDLLAMMGDASDNIPGLPGIGAKTAASLLEEFGSLAEILSHPEKLKGKKRETFEQGKEIALLSRELATIKTDIPIPTDEPFFSLRLPDIEKVRALYQEMHFLTLLKELPQPKMEKGQGTFDFEQEEELYTLINDPEALVKLVETLSTKKELCIDTETTGIHFWKEKLVGIGLGDKPKRSWYIPLNGNIPKEFVIQEISKLTGNREIVFFGHNIKYDLHILKHAGIPLPRLSFDTMIASYLLTPQNPRHGLDLLSLEYFGKTKISITSLIGKGKTEITMAEVPIDQVSTYCCEDVDYTFRLKVLLEQQLEKEQLAAVFKEIELPLIPLLLEMEETGIFLDPEKLHHMGTSLKATLEAVSEEIFTLAGARFNLNSPKQLGEILFEKLEIRPAKKTKTGYSTGADVLESLKDKSPIIEKILTYRVLEKLRSTYVETLPSQIAEGSHRVHCTFNQTGTATGRLSCQDPNLQNIPIRSEEGKKIRSAFLPEKKGWSFLSADYSQIELRLLAHLSEDPELIKAFKKGEDIHTYTASLVYELPIQQITTQMRQNAKAVNFGILYGQSAFGLSKELGISGSEAKGIIEAYFKRFTHVQGYLESSKAEAREKGYSITLFGRKRPIPEMDSKNAFLRQASERLAVNTPLQGSAADLIKLAMISIDQQIRKEALSSSMLLQIHDELLFEVPDSQQALLTSLVKREMEGVVELKVPLVVDISIGKNWEEC